MNPMTTHDSIHRHPLAASLLVVATAGALEVLVKVTIEDLFSLQLSVVTVGIISGAVVSAVGAVAIGWLGVWRELGLRSRPQQARTLLWFLPFAIYGLLPLSAGADVTAGKATAAIVFGLLIAFWKLVMLALVFAWLPRGPWLAAAVTAVSWAGMQLLFGVLTGATMLPTVVLAVSNLFLAFAFIAVRLRTGLMWPLVLSYGLLLATAVSVQGDAASNLATSVEDLVPAVVVSVLLAGYGLAAWPRHRGHSAAPASVKGTPQATAL